MGLVSLVPTDSREAIRQRVELCSSQGLVEREVGLLADCLPLVCDSHLHWDSLSQRHPRTPLQQILLDHPDSQDKNFRVFSAVAVYCWPGVFPTFEQLDALHPRHNPGGPLMATVWIHPISTMPGVQSQLEDLKCLLTHPAVVGLGEVGIDCHHGGPLDRQMSVLEQLFRLADPEKPLVIHCQERDTGDLEAFERRSLGWLGSACPLNRGSTSTPTITPSRSSARGCGGFPFHLPWNLSQDLPPSVCGQLDPPAPPYPPVPGSPGIRCPLPVPSPAIPILHCILHPQHAPCHRRACRGCLPAFPGCCPVENWKTLLQSISPGLTAESL